MLSLSGHKISGLILFLLTLTLSACGNNSGTISRELSDAADSGIIILNIHEDGEPSYDLVTPIYRELSTRHTLTANFHFPQHERMVFQNTNGRVETLVSTGDFVSQGDVLAILRSQDEDLQVNHRLAQLRLEQFERNTELTEIDLQRAIDAARSNLAAATPQTRAEMALRVELEELRLERFLTTAATQRIGLVNTFEELDILVRGEEIIAPFDGRISRTISNNTFINDYRTVVTIANIRYFYFTTQDTSGIIRYGDTVLITHDGGLRAQPLTIKAQVVTDPRAAGPQTSANRTDILLKPLDRNAFFNDIETMGTTLTIAFAFRYNIQLTSNLHPNALSIPLAAIRTIGTRSFVHVYSQGIFSRRYVEVGTRAGDYIQIISGLDENSQVVMFR